jgi:transcriptional antiterminator NusG
MNYYVIQVVTGGEAKYLKLAEKAMAIADPPLVSENSLVWPRRRLLIRRKGRSLDSLAPIFPGYVFLETEDVTPDLHWLLRRIDGFCRFLKDNHHVEPLTGEDRKLLLHFLSYGEVVEKSRVYFDENKRIRVVEGPLKGMEGRIVKVDRRKRRARVVLAMYEDSFRIDFGFELLEPAGEDESTQT